MKRTALLSAAFALALAVTTIHAQDYTPTTPAEIAAYSLGGSSGLPVEDMIIWTVDTDPNQLLGRPGQYTGKVSWHDIRALKARDSDGQAFVSDGTGGRESTIEFFDTPASLQSRTTYVQLWADQPLFAQYVFHDDAHLANLRLPFDLTPAQAAEYQAWLGAL